MKKSELKQGMIVLIRNNKLWMVKKVKGNFRKDYLILYLICNDCVCDDVIFSLDRHNEGLLWDTRYQDRYDIMKVYKNKRAYIKNQPMWERKEKGGK